MSDSSEKPLKIDSAAVTPRVGSAAYPEAFRALCDGRAKASLGDVFGLTQFGVHLTELAPGAWTALRHWHETEDEFVFVLEGTATLATDAGEVELQAGECAGFRSGRPDGHAVGNRTDRPLRLLEIGSRHRDEVAHYPDVDLHAVRRDGVLRFFKKDGRPYD
ncbi:MAG: cupin domain-containing protein [Marivibrio sp.]|uniref:cupin domain-containing protein n=1 Tax=Marivibrio sp. TaxID=2039719 RepID=UPI0032EEE8D3